MDTMRDIVEEDAKTYTMSRVSTTELFDAFALENFRQAIEDGLPVEYATSKGDTRLKIARQLARDMIAENPKLYPHPLPHAGRRFNLNKIMAASSGALVYHGCPHTCGSTERYVSGGGCVKCARTIATEQREARLILRRERGSRHAAPKPGSNRWYRLREDAPEAKKAERKREKAEQKLKEAEQRKWFDDIKTEVAALMKEGSHPLVIPNWTDDQKEWSIRYQHGEEYRKLHGISSAEMTRRIGDGFMKPEAASVGIGFMARPSIKRMVDKMSEINNECFTDFFESLIEKEFTARGMYDTRLKLEPENATKT